MINKEIQKVASAIENATIEDAPMSDRLSLAKYSMVLIESVIENLDWLEAREDLGIRKLFHKYFISAKALEKKKG